MFLAFGSSNVLAPTQRTQVWSAHTKIESAALSWHDLHKHVFRINMSSYQATAHCETDTHHPIHLMTLFLTNTHLNQSDWALDSLWCNFVAFMTQLSSFSTLFFSKITPKAEKSNWMTLSATAADRFKVFKTRRSCSLRWTCRPTSRLCKCHLGSGPLKAFFYSKCIKIYVFFLPSSFRHIKCSEAIWWSSHSGQLPELLFWSTVFLTTALNQKDTTHVSCKSCVSPEVVVQNFQIVKSCTGSVVDRSSKVFSELIEYRRVSCCGLLDRPAHVQLVLEIVAKVYFATIWVQPLYSVAPH